MDVCYLNGSLQMGCKGWQQQSRGHVLSQRASSLCRQPGNLALAVEQLPSQEQSQYAGEVRAEKLTYGVG